MLLSLSFKELSKYVFTKYYKVSKIIDLERLSYKYLEYRV